MLLERVLGCMWRRDGSPELGLCATGTLRPGVWRSSGLVDQQRLQKARSGRTYERGAVQAIAGANLGEESATVLEAQWLRRLVLPPSMRPLHNGQKPVPEAKMGTSVQTQ